MKIAVSGKGGVGKTTVAAALSLLFIEDKEEVIAIDCDPDMNLGFSLDFPDYQKITPISKMKELITQRTEADLDRPQGMFKLNPKVDDIPEEFCPKHKGIHLIVMGKVEKSAGGCMCPENTFIKSLLSHLILNKNEIVILDMVAGSEHLGRATAKNVDCFLIVVEPTIQAINTGLHIKELAEGLGIKKISFLGNRVKTDTDKEFLNTKLKNDILGFISYSKNLEDARGRFSFDGRLLNDFKDIYLKLKSG